MRCAQVLLQQPGYLLHKTAKKRGDNDTLIQVPGMKCVRRCPSSTIGTIALQALREPSIGS